MVSKDLIVDEEYLESLDDYLRDAGVYGYNKALEKRMVKYISKLKEIKAEAITSGDISDALGEFITYAEKLTGRARDIAVETCSLLFDFRDSIDECDRYLY